MRVRPAVYVTGAARRESPLKAEFWIVSVQMSHIAAQCGIEGFYEW